MLAPIAVVAGLVVGAVTVVLGARRHATVGDQRNAYLRRVDDHLGRFGQQEAVHRIAPAAAEAAGRAMR